jgi:hypothetical protein
MGMGDKIRMALRSFLRIEPAQHLNVVVDEEMDFSTTAFCHKLWYRGKAAELNQFYKQIDDGTGRFWGAVPTRGLEIRKIHTGIPKLIVDTLANIVTSDLNGLEFTKIEHQDVWDAVERENSLKDLYSRAIQDALVVGDGAFKISLDSSLSDYPIVEWYSGDRVEFKRDRGRIKEVIFTDEYIKKDARYTLKQICGFGYVDYKLFKGDTSVDLTAIEETATLQNVAFDNSFMLAVPFMISRSERWAGRGASIFESKTDNFDALDEAWSQWVQAMRTSRPVRYIPETCIKRDENNGRMLKPNAFDNQFVEVAADMSERADNKITTEQPDFPSDSYNDTLITALDLALQGLISPSTLGIDVKKLDNAEAQREKEKATLYTRNNIIDALTPMMQKLVDTVFKAYNTARRIPLEELDIDVTFGEYANPSFEAVVETLSNPNTPMSIEAKVDEMWGDTKDEIWKAEEVKRIKEQQGIVTMEEPALNEEFNGGEDIG